jgi:lipid-binding SYLF domain-containing protein
MEGGSFGLQWGAAESDIVLLVMNRRGMDRLLESKFTIGGAAEAAAGPLGRSIEAKTDARMTAQILSWSRSRGVFAGISLNGATLRNDLDENRELYGKRLTNKQILTRRMLMPHSARPLITLLNEYAERERRS